jgi:AraC-like DNA-binding protein
MVIMDAISSAISSVRAGRANGRRLRASGAWGMRFPGFIGIGFHVLLHGEAWLIVEGSTPARLRPGDVVIAPNGAEHGLAHAPVRPGELPEFPRTDRPVSRPDVEFLCGAYRLDHGWLHPTLRGLPETIVVSPDHAHFPKLRTLVGLLENEVSEVQQGNWVTRSALVDLILVHALRHWYSAPDNAGRTAAADPAIGATLDRIHERPQHAWSVQRLAEVAGMSRTSFNRRFTIQVGLPPMTYVTYWRLTCAARLLRQTTFGLATIARQVGYSSEFAFATAFSREYGLAPGQFRNYPDPIPTIN